jgi:regulator of replication initiation timing
MSTPDPKISQLEQLVQQMKRQMTELNQRIQYLERENSRRKNESSQMANAINRK